MKRPSDVAQPNTLSCRCSRRAPDPELFATLSPQQLLILNPPEAETSLGQGKASSSTPAPTSACDCVRLFQTKSICPSSTDVISEASSDQYDGVVGHPQQRACVKGILAET